MEELFEEIIEFPNPKAAELFGSLVGLDDLKNRLVKEAELMLVPSLLREWSSELYGEEIDLITIFEGRPPLFLFAGDVGTGKTAIAKSFGDSIARAQKLPVRLFSLSLNARGTGAVGEMTRLISSAFERIKSEARAVVAEGARPSCAFVLLIDEADSVAQSRELVQMHHEDRAGVNALIRGIDDIAEQGLPVLAVMCTNRGDAIDPAIRRRVALSFDFERPNFERRQFLLGEKLSRIGITPSQIEELAHLTGDGAGRCVGYSYSDFTQRLFPDIVLECYPDSKVTFEAIKKVVDRTKPTPRFVAEKM